MPYGYKGTQPSQTISNSGVFSIDDVTRLTKEGKFGGSYELITKGTVSSAATLDLTSIAEGLYDVHTFCYELARPDTNDRSLTFRLYEDVSGTQTLVNTSNYYNTNVYRLGTSATSSAYGLQSNVTITYNGGNALPYGMCGYINFYNLGNVNAQSYFTYSTIQMYRTSGDETFQTGAGICNRTGVHNGFQFAYNSSANIATMNYKLYGVKRVT